MSDSGEDAERPGEESGASASASTPSLQRRGLLRSVGATGLGSLLGITLGTERSRAHDRVYTDADEQSGTPVSVEELVDRMTLTEKVNKLHMHTGPAPDVPIGYVAPTDRLDIPGLQFADGPAGVRHPQGADPRGARRSESAFNAFVMVLSGGPSTAFPAPVSQISTWDEDRIEEFGTALGLEAKAKDQGCMFAPAFNIVRVPEGGRTFEYFGEDPYLAGRGAVKAIDGIQSTGTIATAKHYIANSQEEARSSYSADVSERALREIYLPAFKAAVRDGEVGSVMAAVNRVNGTYCTEHEWLLTDVLKEEWEFDGYVVSDYMGTNSTVPAATAGLDLEGDLVNTAATGDQYFGPPLERAVRNGAVPESRVDDMVERILGQMDRFGMLDGNRDGPPGQANTREHQQLARDIAAEGGVLLKNEAPGLPIDLDAVDSIAVIGHDAEFAKTGGGGSANVFGPYSVSPLAGIRARAGPDTVVTYESGENDTTAATTLAEQSDVAIVFAAGAGTEGFDRDDLSLDGNQNQLIADVAEANDHTVVVLNTGGPVVMPWVDDVPAILEMWYPGMEDGNATADVLFGDVNPGGKLPVTFGKRREDYPATSEEEYPGVDKGDGYPVAEYSEGVFVGYRHFDEEGIEPLFPFGHGLSYTEFTYRNLEVPPSASADEGVDVELTVENSGHRPGAEVVQVYVHDHEASVERPPKELKAFEKVRLSPGEETRVAFTLEEDAFSFFDPEAGEWVVEPGRFSILVGSSSRDIRLMEDFTLNASRDRTEDEESSTPTTPVVTVSRADDSSLFTGGETNRIDIGVRATETVRVRDRLPSGWTVVAGNDCETYEEAGDRYVEFDAAVEDETLTYLAEAPDGVANTGRYTFGPVEYETDGTWVAASGSTEQNFVFGQGTNG